MQKWLHLGTKPDSTCHMGRAAPATPRASAHPAGRPKFSNSAFCRAIQVGARKHYGGNEYRVLNHLRAELARVGLSSRIDRLLKDGGPSCETLFVLARALGLPMEHFIEEVA